MEHETITVGAHDGTPLSVERWLPDTSPTAVVHIIHGMAEHAARYARLAEQLTARGWAVYADDHRGHGKTAGTPDRLGHLADQDGWNVIMRDQSALLDAERDAHPDLPLVVLGHSLGSIMARDVAIRWGDQLTALVLSGAPDEPGALGYVASALARHEASKGPSLPSPRLDALSFKGYNKPFRPNRTDFDWLSRDEAEVDAYVADPACGFVCSGGFFRDMLTGLRRATSPRHLEQLPARLPVLVAAGAADPVADQGKGTQAVARALTAAGVTDVTCVLFAGARHEIFNELNRGDVTRLVCDWVASRLEGAAG